MDAVGRLSRRCALCGNWRTECAAVAGARRAVFCDLLVGQNELYDDRHQERPDSGSHRSPPRRDHGRDSPAPQRPAAEALIRAHQKLNLLGYGLLIHDAYRPWYVTKMFWDATPDDKKIFVANPQDGSRHNRGCAVDLTLYELKTGKVIEMVGGYDEMTSRSFPNYYGGTSEQRWHRKLLRETMESEGFNVYDYEWWHFDYKDWRQYPIANTRFEDLSIKK